MNSVVLLPVNKRKFEIGFKLNFDKSNGPPDRVVYREDTPNKALTRFLKDRGNLKEKDFSVLDIVEEIEKNSFVVVYDNKTRMFSVNPDGKTWDDDVYAGAELAPWEKALKIAKTKPSAAAKKENDEDDYKPLRSYVITKD